MEDSSTVTIAPAPGRARVVALDVARGLGIFAMVFGHTFDALLSDAARHQPLVAEYWKARGLTAPLFFTVAGWAVTLSVARGKARGLALVGGKLRRAVLLVALGLALRLPGWNWPAFLEGDPETWRHFLAFDALHVIAAALLASSLALALPLGRAAMGGLMLALAVATAAASPWAAAAAPAGGGLGALALGQALAGSSPFPLFPWAAYFFAGATVGVLAPRATWPRVAGLAAAGAALLAGAWLHGLDDLPPNHPALFAMRLGLVLALLAALEGCPRALSSLLGRAGRASLPVYVFHVALVYGWFDLVGLAGRIGPSLSFGEAALAGAGVAAVALAASWAWRQLSSSLRALASERLGRRAPAPVAPPSAASGATVPPRVVAGRVAD